MKKIPQPFPSYSPKGRKTKKLSCNLAVNGWRNLQKHNSKMLYSQRLFFSSGEKKRQRIEILTALKLNHEQ